MVAVEQLLSFRSNDHTYLPADTSELPGAYFPESSPVFSVPAYLVPLSHVVQVCASGSDRGAPFAASQGEHPGYVRCFFHPFRHEGVANAILAAGGIPDERRYLGTPTSSSRTLLVWDEDNPSVSGLLKLSLNATIGNAIRTLTAHAIFRSVGVTSLLDASVGTHPTDFGYMPEVRGTVLPAVPDAGSIERLISQEIRTGTSSLLPVFALFRRIKGQTLLSLLAQQNGATAYDFARETLIRGFTRHWIKLAFDLGFYPEPHAQNLVLAVSDLGQLEPKFVHRDFEGFYVDISFRRRLGLPHPTNLPIVDSEQVTYKLDEHVPRRALKGLLVYFRGSIVYNLDRLFRGDHDMDSFFLDVVVDEVAAVTGERRPGSGDLGGWVWHCLEQRRSDLAGSTAFSAGL